MLFELRHFSYQISIYIMLITKKSNYKNRSEKYPLYYNEPFLGGLHIIYLMEHLQSVHKKPHLSLILDFDKQNIIGYW